MFSGKNYNIKLPLIDNSKLIPQQGALCFAFAMQIVLAYHDVFSRKNLPENFKLMTETFFDILENQEKYDNPSNEDNMEVAGIDLSDFDSLDRFYYSKLLSIWPQVTFSDVNKFMKNKITSFEMPELFALLYGFELLALSDLNNLKNIDDLTKNELENYLAKYGPLIVKGNFGMDNFETLNALPELAYLVNKEISYSIKKVTSAAFDSESEEAHHVVILPVENNKTGNIFYIDPYDPGTILTIEWSDFRQAFFGGRTGILYFPCGIDPSLANQNTVVTGESFTIHREIESQLQNKNDCCHLTQCPQFDFSLNPINLANLQRSKPSNIEEKECKNVSPEIIFKGSRDFPLIQNNENGKAEADKPESIQIKRKIVDYPEKDEEQVKQIKKNDATFIPQSSNRVSLFQFLNEKLPSQLTRLENSALSRPNKNLL